MISQALLAAMVVCSSPRLEFRQFYEHWYGRYPGQTGEHLHIVQERVANASAEFIDYVHVYNEKCR